MREKVDINIPEDIKQLVHSFYDKAIMDETIAHFFTEVMKKGLLAHLPIICSFWESVLLGTGSYKGNPILKHIEINTKNTLTEDHFNKWLKLWEQTIDEHFAGDKAQEAKNKARMMKSLMILKIAKSNTKGFIL